MVVQPVISQVIAGSPAAASGLQNGDRVLQVDATKINDFMQLQKIIVAHPDTSMNFTIIRNGQSFVRDVTLGHIKSGDQMIGRLGFAGDVTTQKHFSPAGAVVAAAQETYSDSVMMLGGLYRLIVHHTGMAELAGPLGIAQITGKVAAMGFISVVNLIALLSINLGLINLVPIPILDGGHLLFYAAEALIGRPVPARAQDIGLRFGVAIILSLFFVTTFNDLTRLGAVTWVAHLFG